jgi:hypothetical protein
MDGNTAAPNAACLRGLNSHAAFEHTDWRPSADDHHGRLIIVSVISGHGTLSKA